MNSALGQQQQMMIPQGQKMIQAMMRMPMMPNLLYPTQQQQWGGLCAGGYPCWMYLKIIQKL